MNRPIPEAIEQLRPLLENEDQDTRDQAWADVSDLLLVLARGLMRRNDRVDQQSVDVAQSIVGDLLKQGIALDEFTDEELRRYLTVVLKHKLGWYARRRNTLKRGAGNRAISFATLSGEGDADFDPRSPMPAPEEDAIAREEAELLNDNLDQLGSDTKMLLGLHLQGVEYHGIAEAMGLSADATRQRMLRARRDLSILVLRQSGESHAAVAAITGLSIEQVVRREQALFRQQS